MPEQSARRRIPPPRAPQRNDRGFLPNTLSRRRPAALCWKQDSPLCCRPPPPSFAGLARGPYAGYPGKDALNEFGLYHLSRADLRFQGNRRGTDVALLTNSLGQGVLLQGNDRWMSPSKIFTETTVLSQNDADGSGRGNKGSAPETRSDQGGPQSKPFRKIYPGFTPPSKPAWPGTLTRWFGQPSGVKSRCSILSTAATIK